MPAAAPHICTDSARLSSRALWAVPIGDQSTRQRVGGERGRVRR
jgi:hypothetical protein